MSAVALPRLGGLARRRFTLPVLAGLLAATSLWSISRGAMPIPAAQAFGALWRHLFATPVDDDAVIVMLRLPRLLLAIMVGGSLACAGAAMQGLFRNPLADPGLVGVSAGAALGAVAAIVGGAGAWAALLGQFAIAGAAFTGGLLTTALVYVLGRRRGGVASLLLAGVAINAIAMAGVGLMTFMADEHQLRDLTFWSLGSLGGADWQRIAVLAPLLLLPMVALPRMAGVLNALLLGEHEATLLGFHTVRLQRILIGWVALAVSAAVATTGVIGFVGLVVPHLLRLSVGPDHRLLLPASALGGAVLLVAADTLARSLAAPAELPVGVLTALIGGPFFLWLLLRSPIGVSA